VLDLPVNNVMKCLSTVIVQIKLPSNFEPVNCPNGGVCQFYVFRLASNSVVIF